MKRPLCLMCLFFVLTIFCYLEWHPASPYILEAYAGTTQSLTGQVYQKEIKEDQLILYLNHVTICDKEQSMKSKQNIEKETGKLICYCQENNSANEPKIGAVISVKGELESFAQATNPGEFDSRQYYRIQGIACRMKRTDIKNQGIQWDRRREMLYQVRKGLSRIFDATLDVKDASIMKAMLLGEKQELDKESKNIYQKAGISHILAISGLHISLLGMGLYKMLRRFRIPLIPTAVVCVFVMVQYGEMTGMASSAYRAIVMFGCRMLARCLKRSYDMLTSMTISCMLLLVEQPLYIYHTGFLLSFGAIMGIGLMTPVFCDKKLPDKKHIQECIRHPVRAELYYVLQMAKHSLQGSLSISVIHFPILLCQNSTFPIYSFFLNLWIIPLMGIVLCLGICILLIAYICMPITCIPAILLHFLLVSFEKAAIVSLTMYGGIWNAGHPAAWQLLFYLVMLLCLYAVGERLPRFLCYLWVLAGIAVLSGTLCFHPSITMLDVGQGDGIYVRTEQGHHYLIDGGSTSKNKLGEYQLIPFLKYQGVNQIESIFLTHLDEDHTTGVLTLLQSQKEEGIRVRSIILAKAVVRDEAYEQFMDVCRQMKVPVYYMSAGDMIHDGKMTFTCLFPSAIYQTDDRNAASLVLSVAYGDFVGVFTGDVSADGEEYIVNTLKEENRIYQLFKAAHHGSRFSNTGVLLDTLQPQTALISCGEDNRYGHPHSEALERFEERQIKIYQTPQSGAIKVDIFDDYYRMETFRKKSNKNTQNMLE